MRSTQIIDRQLYRQQLIHLKRELKVKHEILISHQDDAQRHTENSVKIMDGKFCHTRLTAQTFPFLQMQNTLSGTHFTLQWMVSKIGFIRFWA